MRLGGEFLACDVIMQKTYWDAAGTKHRSQVIVLGCFSIGKTMTCDLCFVPADWDAFLELKTSKVVIQSDPLLIFCGLLTVS